MDHIKPFIYRFNHDSWSYSPCTLIYKESGRNFLTIPTPVRNGFFYPRLTCGDVRFHLGLLFIFRFWPIYYTRSQVLRHSETGNYR